MEATYTLTYKFMVQKSIFLNDLIIHVSGINGHGETSNFNSFKSRHHNTVVLVFSMGLGFKCVL